MTVKAIDAAVYILKKMGQMSAMKLQKLLYYAQAWSLVWDDAPLFEEEIQAWANGPVIPALFEMHKGRYFVDDGYFEQFGGNSENLNQEQRDTVDSIIKFYGDKDSQWLSDLTHQETPWRNARRELADGERGNAVLSHADMAEYYSNIR